MSSAIGRERMRLLDGHRDRHAQRLWVSGRVGATTFGGGGGETTVCIPVGKASDFFADKPI